MTDLGGQGHGSGFGTVGAFLMLDWPTQCYDPSNDTDASSEAIVRELKPSRMHA